MKVALAQLNPAAEPERDCDTVCAVIDSLSDTDLVLFPELFVGGYNPDDPAAAATTSGGPGMTRIGEACARAGTAAVVGFTEVIGEHRFANSAACFGDCGELAGVYRKAHLFGPRERAAFVPGDSMFLVPLAGRIVGPQICFDVEFPEPSRLMAGAGAEVLATISANMEPFAADHRLAARARALDNRLPHLYVNRVGFESGHRFTGESCVIAPDGSVIAGLGREAEILETEIDVPAAASDTSYLEHLRSDLKVIVQDNANGGEA